jgi:hypothetical protein
MRKVYYTIKAGLGGAKPDQVLARARNLVARMTGHPAYTDVVPTLPTVTAACDALEAALEAHVQNPGPREKETRDLRFSEARALYADLCGYAQARTNGDRTRIEELGLEVRRDPAPIGRLDAPAQLLTRARPYPGMLYLRWSAVKGRLFYELEICLGEPAKEEDWSLLLRTSKNTHTAEGLVPGQLYFFRVKAVGTAGASPLSETTSGKAA